MKPWICPAGAVSAVALALAACSPVPSARVARSDLPRESAPGLPAGTILDLASSNNAFALDFFKSLDSEPGNLTFSPFSISLALAMPYAGARGETEAQMARALHFDLPQDSLHAAFNQLDLSLIEEGKTTSGETQPFQLEIANSAWADQTVAFVPRFLDTLAKDYGAGVQLTDFIHQPETARGQINSWVAQETQQKIKDLIPRGVLDQSARLVLVNAIYFKADWQTPFEADSTNLGAFTRLDGSQVQVPMMVNSSLSAAYSAGSGYQAVELPYQGGSAVMDLILPDPGVFADFEARLDAPLVNQIVSGMQPASLDFGMPKFRIASALDLGQKLSELGMSDAIDPNRADFSGITGKRDLFISKVLHQAWVAVDEKGTEAAAATSVIMKPTSILADTIPLKLDRPFIFLIRDSASGQILFLGRVLDPTQQ